MTIGAKIDKLYKIKLKIALANKKVDAIKLEYKKLEDEIYDELSTEKLEVSEGKLGRASRKKENTPTVTNWNKLHEYIVENDAFDLLQKRVSSTAFRARWDEKVKIPGVKKFKKTSLNLTKRAKR